MHISVVIRVFPGDTNEPIDFPVAQSGTTKWSMVPLVMEMGNVRVDK